MVNEPKVLAYIPARSGSKRIPGKNIKNFLGKPLIAYSIEQAKQIGFIDKIVVDTDSAEIAAIAKEYGAEAPYLRPPELAGDNAKILDSMFYCLRQLKEKDGYEPEYLVILQVTSPLREKTEVEECWKLMRETGATTTVTICATHPKFYHLDEQNDLKLANGTESFSTNTQDWPAGYILNGSVFIVNVRAMTEENKIMTEKTKAVLCPKWRSIDIDVPEEWVMSEWLYKNKEEISNQINRLEKERL